MHTPAVSTSSPPSSRTEHPWRIFLIQHSHIDIGFTDRQEVIADYHRQFIAQAIDLALSPEQDDRSPETRFKFTCEGFWAVEQFLQSAASPQVDQLVRALRAGVIELSATYLHLTELLDTGHLRDSLRPAREFADRHGIPLRTAMSCDINGVPWSMADALADIGVRYLCTNINRIMAASRSRGRSCRSAGAHLWGGNCWYGADCPIIRRTCWV